MEKFSGPVCIFSDLGKWDKKKKEKRKKDIPELSPALLHSYVNSYYAKSSNWIFLRPFQGPRKEEYSEETKDGGAYQVHTRRKKMQKAL